MHCLIVGALSLGVVLVGSSSAGADNDLESWYILVGLGSAGSTYPDRVEDMGRLAEARGAWDDAMSGDMGVYWPWGEHTLVGIARYGSQHRYHTSDVVKYRLEILSEMLGASAVHFWRDRIGKGPFVRLDLGPTILQWKGDMAGDTVTKWGVGALLGGGWGVPVLGALAFC